VTEEACWACVAQRQLPDRGTDHQEPPGTSLPAGLVHQLIHVVGVPEGELSTMALDDALEIMRRHWSRPKG
jgi:hypothetical protein